MRAVKVFALLAGIGLLSLSSGCHLHSVRLSGPRGGYVEVGGPRYHGHGHTHVQRRVVREVHHHGPGCGCHHQARYVRVERGCGDRW